MKKNKEIYFRIIERKEMKWLIDKVGIIGCVCAGLLLTGMGVLLCVPAIPVAIAAGIHYAVVGLGIATYSTGLIYSAHRYGVSQERQRNADLEESAQIVNHDQQQVNALEAIANGATREYNVESSATVSRIEFLALQATVTSQGRDILSLQQAQATRFRMQALSEMHNERDRGTRDRTQGSDSDSSDDDRPPLAGGSNTFFSEPTSNIPAANEPIGATLRRRNSAIH